MQLKLPNRDGLVPEEDFDTEVPIVIVGANGSGKSRLGFWVNNHNHPVAHMISAQRSLQLPLLNERWTLQRSNSELNGNRIGSATQVQSDYHIMLQILFAQEARRDSDYLQSSRADASEKKLQIPSSSIDEILDIWASVLPQRSMKFADNKVEVQFNGATYVGSEMSDGERVALYLIGKCLIVPENSIIIIDEPELHLHRALMSALWNKVEEARNDCQFVYITHDLDFAASRTRAKKIWVKAFEGADIWTWEEVPEVDEIPESLVLEIIGSRKPILFVEGEKGSYDYEIYQYLFPTCTVIPRGGCEKVIESTKALRTNDRLHTFDARGLIDRDYRSEGEIEGLRDAGILFAEVAEIENLLISEDIIRIVSAHLARDPDETVKDIRDFVIEELTADFERQVSRRSALEINFRLNTYNQKAVGKAELQSEITNLTASIDVGSIYDKNAEIYQRIIDGKSLEDALKNYLNKGLLPRVSRFLGLRDGEYPKLVLGLLKTDKKEAIINGLRKYILET